MPKKLLAILIVALLGGMLVAASALADKLICVSKEELRGQETVDNCLVKGERFAIIDEHGAVRILGPEEIKTMKRLNPKAFEQSAYGILYHKEAPEMPKLPPLAVPKLAH